MSGGRLRGVILDGTVNFAPDLIYFTEFLFFKASQARPLHSSLFLLFWYPYCNHSINTAIITDTPRPSANLQNNSYQTGTTLAIYFTQRLIIRVPLLSVRLNIISGNTPGNRLLDLVMSFITPDTDRYRQIQVHSVRISMADSNLQPYSSNPMSHPCQCKKTRKPDDHDIFHLAYNLIAGFIWYPWQLQRWIYSRVQTFCVSLTAG